MTGNLTDKVREYIDTRQGRDIEVSKVRIDLNLNPASNAWEGIYTIFNRLVAEKKLRASGRRDGVYRVIKQVAPISVFDAPLSEPLRLYFPKDFNTGLEMTFANDIVIREGDLILISGRSNYGKTQMCLSFAGENIDSHPVLMGNEYTTLENKPSPRFLNRIKNMDWVKWQDENGKQKFTLLPVRSDYAEHIMKDRINIIDWVNIETGEHYLIGTIMESIKRELGRGIGIIAIQKAEGVDSGRGGQFTKDFSDVEILLDKLPESDDVLLTLGKVKESSKRASSRNFAYGIQQGVKIINFRELRKCKECFGKGWKYNKPCEVCHKVGYIAIIDETGGL